MFAEKNISWFTHQLGSWNWYIYDKTRWVWLLYFLFIEVWRSKVGPCFWRDSQIICKQSVGFIVKGCNTKRVGCLILLHMAQQLEAFQIVNFLCRLYGLSVPSPSITSVYFVQLVNTIQGPGSLGLIEPNLMRVFKPFFSNHRDWPVLLFYFLTHWIFKCLVKGHIFLCFLSNFIC